MKEELMIYISNQMAQLKEMEKTIHISINFDKIHLLLEEWMIKYSEFTMEDLDIFFENIHQIINAESEIRKRDLECKSVWLTK